MLIVNTIQEPVERGSIREYRVGPGFKEWLENEPAPGQLGMGNSQAGLIDSLVAVQEEIEVEGPRPPADVTGPATCQFGR